MKTIDSKTFWQRIVKLGPAGRRVSAKPIYFYKHLVEKGKEKLFFRSDGAAKDYRILKPKVEEYFNMLYHEKVDVAWFVQNRSSWFYDVFRDVMNLE